jgi:CubicO group peptidase (beta-lactamase class C family)
MTKTAQVAGVLLIIGLLLGTLTTSPLASSSAQLRMTDAADESAIVNREPNVRPDNTISSQQLKARLDRFIPAAMAELNVVPGLSIAVVRNDKIVYSRGFGFADVEAKRPVGTNTRFYAASMIKSFTAMTAVILASQGKLDLNAPLTQLLPGLQLPATVDQKKATVRGLLSHNPGFGNSTVNYVTTFVRPYDSAELVRILNTYSQPSNGFRYANMNYALVGYIINNITGHAWQSVMEDLVLRPLDMNKTTAHVSRAKDVAKPYSSEREGFELIRLPKSDRTITGAGGIFTTAEDVANFVRASMHNGRIDGRQALPAQAVQMTQQTQVPAEGDFTYYHRKSYALGLYLATYEGEPMMQHFGGISGYKAHMSYMPQHDSGVVVLQNEGSDGGRFSDLIASYAYDLLLGADADGRARARIEQYRTAIEKSRSERDAWRTELKKLKTSPVAPALPLTAYVGSYGSDRLGRIEISIRSGRIHVSFGDAAGDGISVGGHEFLIDWNPGDRPDRWKFDVTNGGVTGFHWGDRVFTRSR